jgi:hypothetical protein
MYSGYNPLLMAVENSRPINILSNLADANTAILLAFGAPVLGLLVSIIDNNIALTIIKAGEIAAAASLTGAYLKDTFSNHPQDNL